MSLPVLVCQGFQRTFIDPASLSFSVSATLRRTTCEQILRCARNSGWTVIHAFLDTPACSGIGSSSIDGFAPRPSEAYFRQKTLSAFDAPGFAAKLSDLAPSLAFLMSFSGLGAIAATFLAGFSRRLPMHIICDAIADCSQFGVSEQERLLAIETLARAHELRTISSMVIDIAADQGGPVFGLVAGSAS